MPMSVCPKCEGSGVITGVEQDYKAAIGSSAGGSGVKFKFTRMCRLCSGVGKYFHLNIKEDDIKVGDRIACLDYNNGRDSLTVTSVDVDRKDEHRKIIMTSTGDGTVVGVRADNGTIIYHSTPEK